MTRKRTRLWLPALLLTLFALWTIGVKTIDVAAIGPEDSSVGFSTLNAAVRDAVGRSDTAYKLSKYLGYVSLLTAAGFMCLALGQALRRGLRGVEPSLYVLAAYYAAVLACYLFFEKFIVNYRPVILDAAEGLAASYPSSHTLLALSILGAAMLRLRRRLPPPTRGIVVAALGVLMLAAVLSRVLSGVHWASDIIGSVLISAALLAAYQAAVDWAEHRFYRPRHGKK